MSTEVINVRRMAGFGMDSVGRFVYVGPGYSRFNLSPWWTPFEIRGNGVKVNFSRVKPAWWMKATVGPGTAADRAMEYYRQWVLSQPDLKIPDLAGKLLGCLCCDWKPGDPIVVRCHAIVLAQLANSLALPAGAKHDRGRDARDAGSISAGSRGDARSPR